MWNKGHLSVTGKVCDLRRFVKSELVPIDKFGCPVMGAMRQIVDWDGNFWYRNTAPVPICLSGVHKGIVNTDDIVAHAASDDDFETMRVSFRKPCDVEEDVLCALSLQYGVDIQVYLANYQEQTSRLTYVHAGEVMKDEARDIDISGPRIITRETYA